MAISNPIITAQPIEENTSIVIDMLNERPVLGQVFSPARPAGQLCGYYDSMRGLVELYMVSASGIRFMKVV